MGQIRITPEQMRSRAGEYRMEADAVGDVITKMDTLLGALESEWEGASARAYSARFADLRPKFIEAQDLINEIASSLDSTAMTLEDADRQIAARF